MDARTVTSEEIGAFYEKHLPGDDFLGGDSNRMAPRDEDIGIRRRPLRLLVVSSDTYPPTRVDVTVLFAEELAGRGHTIDWLLQSEGGCSRPYVVHWNGGQVWVGPTDLGTSLLSRMRKHLLDIVHDMKLFSLVRSGSYDVVEVKDKFLSGIFALMAARLYHKRFVYWLSWPSPEEYLTRAIDGTGRYPFLYRIRGLAFKALLYRLLLPAADHVFVQSEQMKRDIAAEGIPLAKMTAVPMGIKFDRIAMSDDREQRRVIPPGERCVLYLGTLSKVRRLDFLIRVFADVHKHCPDVKLYIVGRGDDQSDEQLLIAEVQKWGVQDCVVFVGQLPQWQALQYVREADVCVSPFFPTPILNSTSPTKLVEYMAMGKAVVANDHPEQRLVLEESRGGYCVPWSESEFAQAVVKLLESPALAREMGARGRVYALQHRSYGRIADVVEREFFRIVDNQSARYP